MDAKHSSHLKQTQVQNQKLSLTQNMQQSLHILQFNSPDLLSFLREKTLDNPLIAVKLPEQTKEQRQQLNQISTLTPDKHQALLEQLPAERLSLFEQLLEQIHLNYRDTFLRSLLCFLVGYIDSNGYLTLPLEAAAKQTGASMVELLDALTLLQQLEPAGVGARTLKECLMLQTERDDHAPDIAYLLLEEQFEPLVQHKWGKIAPLYGITLKEVQLVFDYIQTLTPRPGTTYNQVSAAYITPDLEVTIVNQELSISSTRESQPQLIFQQKYYDKYAPLAETDPELKHYLKDRKSEYDLLKTAITNRGETVLRVGTEIITRQADFFHHTDHPLKPLTMKEIAEQLNLHESTISRAVNQKYMRTPFGIYELKTFFTQGITTNQTNGETTTVANTTIKQKLQEIIQNENKQAPLSDQKIAEQLSQAGFTISRRTVVKYRESCGIPASSKRKRY